MQSKHMLVKVTVVVVFLVTVIVNAQSALAPIDGNSPQVVSDFYANLFAPAGLTFSIWTLIYVLLAVYCVFQFVFKEAGKSPAFITAVNKSRILFIVSSLANIAWVFSWQLKAIPLSLILMLVLLASLVAITALFVKLPMKLNEKVMLSLPFSIYFGWITIATIANVTVLLVYANWNGFGIASDVWTALVLVVGTLIGCAIILRRKDVAYGLVLVWAYAGIMLKHGTDIGFAGTYPLVMVTAGICGGLILAVCLIQVFRLFTKPAVRN